MSDPTGSETMRARINAGSRSGQGAAREAREPTARERNEAMTAEERRAFAEENEGTYGPGTLVGGSGRVFNIVPGREPGLFTGILNQTLTTERFAGQAQAAQQRPAESREPAERTTRRRGRGGGGGSTTLLTADGLDSSRASQRRTVLGA